MARYASDNRLNLKVGVSSFSKDLTSVEVIGRVGINSATAQNELDVAGSVNITDGLSVGGLSTFTGVGTFGSDLYVGGNLNVVGDLVYDEVTGRNLNITGIATVGTELYVDGNLTVTGFATVTQDLHVDNDLLVGSALTANKFYGNGIGLTGITSATNATHIYGGSSGQLVYQDQPGITSSLYNGSTNQVLASRGTGNPPQWVQAAPAGAIEGLLVFDEGTQVGLGTTYSGLDFRGIDVSVAGGNDGGIATVTVTQQTYVLQAGVATAVIGGGASVTSLSNSGITTLGSLNVNGTTRANNGLIVTGITTLGIVTTDVTFNDNVDIVGVATIGTSLDVNGPSSLLDTVVTGVVTATQYVGDGIRLSGIVTTITAGPNISVDNNTGNVTITSIAQTSVITANSLFVSGIATLNAVDANSLIVSGITTLGVVTGATYYGNGNNLTGIVTSLVAGTNIALSGSQGQVTITGLANTARVSADTLVVSGISTLGIITGAESLGVGTVYATTILGDGVGMTGIVTSLTAGENIAISGSTGNVTITGLAKTDRINADSLVVTGISTLGIITGAESLGVGTVYATNIVGGTFNGGTATFSGNVTIGGTLTYEDVKSVDAVGFVTARQGINVGFVTTGGSPVTDYSEVTLSGLTPGSFNTTYVRQTTGFVLDNGAVASGSAQFHADSNYYYYIAASGSNPNGRVLIYSELDTSWVVFFDTTGNFSEGNVSENDTIGSGNVFNDLVTSNSTTADGRNVPTASSDIVYATTSGSSTSGIGVTILADGNAVFAGIVTAKNLEVVTELNVGSATSQFNVVSSGSSIMVGIGTTSPDYTLDVRGDTNIEGDLTVDGNTVPTLAMVIALGGL